MNNVNIFEVAKEKKMASWAKFKNPGDSIQGTYVGKIMNFINPAGRYKTPQNIYQILKNGEVFNVAFTLNKKNIHQIMSDVPFGRIVGFVYKGKITIPDKMNPGSIIEVNDFAIFTDPKIVDTDWLKDNADCMPNVINLDSGKISSDNISAKEETERAFQEFSQFGASEGSPVPSTDAPASITPEDKLAVITKLAKDKLGVSDPSIMKDRVMEITQVAFLPLNYDRIISVLNTIGA